MSAPPRFTPTESQARALDLDKGKLVIAGAGAGKTSVLAERYLRLLEAGLQPGQIVAMVFGRKAAAALRSKVHAGLRARLHHQPDRAEFWLQVRDAMTRARIGTVHAFCGQLVHAYPREAGVDPEVVVSPAALHERRRRVADALRRRLYRDDPDLDALLAFLGHRGLESITDLLLMLLERGELRDAVRAAEADPEAARRFLDDQTRSIAERLAIPAASGKKAPPPLNHRPFLELLGHAGRLADAIRQREPAAPTRLSFDGVEYAALRLLESDGEAAWEVRRSFRALLVDEFQDTSTIQWRLIQALLRTPEGGVDAGKAFFVGDEKQSIFGFRKANVTVVNRARDWVRERPERVDEVQLADSFRSQRALLDRLNPVLDGLLGRGIDLSLDFAAHPQPLQWVHDELPDSPDLVAVRAVIGGDTRQQLQPVIDEIRRLTGRDVPTAHDPAPSLPPPQRRYADEEIAVLLRTRTHLADLELSLQAAQIPYTVHGGRGFLERQEVQDLVQLVNAFADPRDKLAFAALLRGPFVGLPDTAVAALFFGTDHPRARWRGWYEGTSTTPLLEQLDAADRELLREGYDRWLLLADGAGRREPGRWLRDALDRTGALAALGVGPRGEQRLANVQQFLDLVRGWVVEEGPSLRALRRRIVAEIDLPEDDSEADVSGGRGVKVMTMHGAKGLEFPVVMLPLSATASRSGRDRPPSGGNLLVDPTSPFAPLADPVLNRVANAATPADETTFHGWLKDHFSKAESEAEERRLLYVAATRAKERLFVVPQLKEQRAEGRSPAQLWLTGCGLGYDPKAGSVDVPPSASFHCDVVRGKTLEPDELVPGPRPDPTATAPVEPDPHAAPAVRLQPGDDPPVLHLPLEGFAGWIARGDEATARELLQFAGGDNGTAAPRGGSGDEAEVLRLAGTLLHRTVEQFGPGVDPARAEDWLAAQLNAVPAAIRAATGARARELIQAGAGLTWELPGDVRREWPVLLRLGPVALRGRADLAWREGETAVALDLKTNDVAPDGIDDLVTHSGYDHQARLYALVLAAAWKAPRAEGRLLFLPAGKTHRYPVDDTHLARYAERAQALLHWAREHV